MHTELKPGKNKVQGLIAFFGGLVLLLYALGMLQQGLNVVVIGLAFALIVYGAMSSGLDQVFERVVEKLKHLMKKH